MSMKHIIEAAERSVGAATREYAKGRARRAALAEHQTAGDVLTALQKGASTTAEQRGAIVAALVAEYHESAHPLWHDVLLVTFAPQLLKLRRVLGAPWEEDEDKDQTVRVAFVGALRSLSARPHALTVTKALVRALGHQLRAELHAAGELTQLRVIDVGAGGWDPTSSGLEEAESEGVLADVRRMLAASGGEDEGLAVVLATCAGNELLEEYVDRVHPDACRAEHVRIRERLYRLREKTLRRLRDELSPTR